MLVDMRGAVVNGTVQRLSMDKDGDTGNDYVIDCRRSRSPDVASIDGDRSQNLSIGIQPASPMSAKATYWNDIVDNGKEKMATIPRRCGSCSSDVSVTSLPESLASNNDTVDSPPCKNLDGWTATSTGNSFTAARQPEGKVESPPDIDIKSTATSGRGYWSRDSAVRPSPPTAVGFSIADILRPDFGKTPSQSDFSCQQQKEAPIAVRRCPSYPTSVSLLPSSLRRSLVHPYTAAAAFCAAAVAAAAAGVHGATDAVQQANSAGVRRLTSSRDVTYRAINNNNAKLRSRYVYEDKDEARRKTAAERRTRVHQHSPSSTSVATAKPVSSRPDQSAVVSPTVQSTSSTSTDGPAVVEAKQSAGDGGSSPSLAPLPWPAWVYCTRYSDRPSSGRQVIYHLAASSPAQILAQWRGDILMVPCRFSRKVRTLDILLKLSKISIHDVTAARIVHGDLYFFVK